MIVARGYLEGTAIAIRGLKGRRFMSVKFLDHLPDLDDFDGHFGLVVHGLKAFLRTPSYLVCIDLPTAKTDWLIERSAESHGDNHFWISDNGELLAEIQTDTRREISVCLRNPQTGREVWKQSFPCPDPADAFFAADSQRLVILRSRQSQIQKLLRPAPADVVTEVRPRATPTTASRLDPVTGATIWSDAFPNLLVRDVERADFTGLWCRSPWLGFLDLESGVNTIIHQSSNELGWSPIRVGATSAVAWHSRKEIGINWFDEHGTRIRYCVIDKPGARDTRLCDSGAGLALNLNSAEMFWWFGDGDQPLWSGRAKPYIYRVHRAPGTDLFVGTDGNGGRLYGFDPKTGVETLNLKPALGGVGDLSRLPGQNTLVASFRVSKSYSVSPRLLVVSMDDGSHYLDYECEDLLGTWQHGAICRAGKEGERLAIVDLRS